MIHQQKDLDLSFNLTSWKWAWHYQEGATPSRREKHRCAWGKKSCSTARGPGSLMIMSRPLSGYQIQRLSAVVLFVSVPANSFSGYWKALNSGNDFRNLYNYDNGLVLQSYPIHFFAVNDGNLDDQSRSGPQQGSTDQGEADKLMISCKPSSIYNWTTGSFISNCRK